MQEFEEISHTGGKIEFIYDPKQGIQARVSNSSFNACTMFEVCVSDEGEVIDTVPIRGMQTAPTKPKHLLPAFVLSDKEGLFGRVCPKCESYFRTNEGAISYLTCPYCLHNEKSVRFTTRNQQDFLKYYCDKLIEAATSKKNIIIDINKAIEELKDNKPKWLYAEKRQQYLYVCKNCKCKYDILGEYGACPCCEETNFREVINGKLDKLLAFFDKKNLSISDRIERSSEWCNFTSNCVSYFESMANELKKYINFIPMTKKRRQNLNNLSFQNVLKANERLLEWFDINYIESIPKGDCEFLNKMFNKRHLITHKNCRVDKEYLQNTNDKSLIVNQEVRIKSTEVKRLIPLVKKISNKLLDDFEGITSPE